MKTVKIEFFHDTICSFCFPMSYKVRNLKKELPEVEIIHRSFGLVKQESDFIDMFGSREKAKEEIMSHWKRANQIDDLHRFNIDGMKKQSFLFPTSMNALHACKAASFAKDETLYWDLFDVLQYDFFVKNIDISDEEVIFNEVKLLDVDFEKWLEFYKSQEVKDAVKKDFALAQKYGLNSVPALVINGYYVINGVVSVDELVKIISDFKQNDIEVINSGDACESDGSY